MLPYGQLNSFLQNSNWEVKKVVGFVSDGTPSRMV
jgi:hypothetical protein